MSFRRFLGVCWTSGTACTTQKPCQHLPVLPGAGVGFVISRCAKHKPDFPWVKLPGSINERYLAELTCRVAKASSQGADGLSQEYCHAECGFAVSPCWGPALVLQGGTASSDTACREYDLGRCKEERMDLQPHPAPLTIP